MLVKGSRLCLSIENNDQWNQRLPGIGTQDRTWNNIVPLDECNCLTFRNQLLRDFKAVGESRAQGVAIFAKACFGPPSPSKQQKSRDRSCLRRPSRPAAFALTQQGVKASVHNDSTRCRTALHFPYAKSASGKRPALSLLGTTRLPASQRLIAVIGNRNLSS